jgi:hypothetical protein
MRIGLRRAEVAAFWIVLTTLVMTAVGLLCMVLGLNRPAAWALGGLLILLPGLFRNDWFELGVRAWNKGAGLVAARLRAYVLRVCYFLFLAVTSWSGSALRLAPGVSGASGWMPRSGGAGKRANAWMVLLKPFVALLRLLRDDTRESAPPSSTYTLY